MLRGSHTRTVAAPRARRRICFSRKNVANCGPSATKPQCAHPAIQQVVEDNAALRQRLAIESKHRLDQQLERASPTTVKWIPVLPGGVGSAAPMLCPAGSGLLNDAVAVGSADRVIHFFRQFLRENQVAGQASGRSQPAARSNASAPSSKHVYTRAEIGERGNSMAPRGAESNGTSSPPSAKGASKGLT